MLTTRSVVQIFSVVMTVLGASAVCGQDYPNKAIRIFTGNPGGSNDAASRLIAQGISGPLGQPVIVENRGTPISTQIVASSPPDGYSLILGGDLLWINPLLRGLPNALEQFAPISMLASAPNILCVHPSMPVKSVKELIALAKARPGELNVSATAPGSIDHLMTELFKSMTGVKIVTIHYNGAAAAVALAGGEVHLSFPGVAVATPHIRSGKMRALAVTSAQPSSLAAGVPTLAASGLPGFDLAGQDAFYAPAKTPAAIINRLNQEIVRFLKTKDAQEKYLNLGAEVRASSPEEHVVYLKSRTAVIGKLIKDAGIKIQ